MRRANAAFVTIIEQSCSDIERVSSYCVNRQETGRLLHLMYEEQCCLEVILATFFVGKLCRCRFKRQQQHELGVSMKVNVLTATWILALAVASFAFVTPTFAAAQQSQQNQTINHPDSKDNANNLM